jgi:hypothetical protein
MAKPKDVNVYKSGVHNPEVQVFVHRKEDGKVKVVVLDWSKNEVKEMEA